MSADLLIDKIREKHCPCCVGLDTRPEYIPVPLVEETRTALAAAGRSAGAAALYAAAAFRFNARLLDAVADLIPAVSLQCSHYDLYGPAGAETLRRTVLYAREKGLYVILDGKRNDVGLVAEACADACPVPMMRLALPDEPVYEAESPEVFEHYGLTAEGICEHALALLGKVE